MRYTQEKLVGKIILLNGKDITAFSVVEADDHDGWVKARRRNATAKIPLEPRTLIKLRGKVEVKEKALPVPEPVHAPALLWDVQDAPDGKEEG